MIKKIKLCIAAIKIICHNAVLSLIRVPLSVLCCKLLLRKKNTHYVVICDHIGDFLITMGYLPAFKNQHNHEHITVCITGKFKNLLAAYPTGWDSYQLLSTQNLYKLLTMGSTNFGTHVLNKLGNITLINPADAFIEEAFQYIMRYPTVTLKDCIQYGCLHLNLNAYFYPPRFSEKAYFKNITEFQIGRTVVLSPFSRATSIETGKFFETLVRSLKKYNFTVLTNLSNANHKPVAGTQGILCTLEQIVPLTQAGGYVIGVRSGLLDLLAYAKCRMVAIYPDIPECQSFFDLRQLPETQAEILQITQIRSASKNLEKILTFLQGGESWA